MRTVIDWNLLTCLGFKGIFFWWGWGEKERDGMTEPVFKRKKITFIFPLLNLSAVVAHHNVASDSEPGFFFAW